jgi:Spy/CpxP family protein refolding chaperone
MQKRRADPTRALLEATRELELTPAQKDKVRALDEQHRNNERYVAGAAQTLQAGIAAQVRAGQVDASKIQAHETGLVNAIETHVAKATDIINELHAVLNLPQRRDAAASARATLASARAKLAASAEQPGLVHGGSPQEVSKRKLDRLTRQLDLDAAQQQQVAAWLSEHPPAHDRNLAAKWRQVDAMLSVFEADTFDAKTKIPPDIGAEVREHADRKMALLSMLVPILTSDQREKLATNIEKRAFTGDHEND